MRAKHYALSIPIASALVFLLLIRGTSANTEPALDIERLYQEKRDAVVMIISELNKEKAVKDSRWENRRTLSFARRQVPPPLEIHLMPYRYQINTSPDTKTYYSFGSGFVIRKTGLVITNYHVVDDARKITVQFSDGNAYPAEVIGFDSDPESDLVLLRVSTGRELSSLVFSQQPAVPVGKNFFIIGHPYATKYVAATAMISRVYQGSEGQFLQVQSSIHPGNSGSPIINERGEVVGIVFATLGESETLGLAIPAKKIQQIIERILQTENERREPPPAPPLIP